MTYRKRKFFLQLIVNFNGIQHCYGNKPSTNISIIVVQKCTELSDISVRLQEACEVLMKDIYVDNVFVTGPDKQ